MCEPATIVSLTMAAVSAAVSAYGMKQQGKAQQAQAQYQADQANANAQAARDKAEVQAAQKAREVQQKLGTQRANFAASGADISDQDTSAANVLGDTAQWGDYDRRLIQYNGEMQAWNFENQAQGLEFEGKNAAKAGNMNAAASLIGGASKVAKGWYDYSSGGGTSGGSGGSGKFYDPALQKNVSSPVRH